MLVCLFVVYSKWDASREPVSRVLSFVPQKLRVEGAIISLGQELPPASCSLPERQMRRAISFVPM